MAFERGRFIEVLDKNEITPSEDLTNGKIYEILALDKDGDLVILDDSYDSTIISQDEFHAIKLVPNEVERIAALEGKVTELELIVEGLRKSEVDVETVDVYERIEPSTSDAEEQPVQQQTVKSPNQLRAEIIEKAKRYLKENKNSRGHYEVPDLDLLPFLCNADFIANEEKRTIVVLLRGYESNNVYARGIAKCNPSDVFNEHIGKAIALGRALGLDVSEFEGAVQPTEVVVGMVVNGNGRSKYYSENKFFTLSAEGSESNSFEFEEDVEDFIYRSQIGKIINDTNAIYSNGGV